MNCKQIQKLSSEYIDNTLSARDTMDVDSHVAACNPCALFLNEMRHTVLAIAEAPRFEVSADFMANLQTRLVNVEPMAARRTIMDIFHSAFRPQVRPVWATGLALCGLAAFFMVPHNSTVEPFADFVKSSEPVIVQQARTQNIALAATDPFGDPAAASLAASRSVNGPSVVENP